MLPLLGSFLDLLLCLMGLHVDLLCHVLMKYNHRVFVPDHRYCGHDHDLIVLAFQRLFVLILDSLPRVLNPFLNDARVLALLLCLLLYHVHYTFYPRIPV